MSIDWFTFVAQLLNFLILLALLRRFLYRPITATLERREREIADRVREAEEERGAAEEEARELRRRQTRLEEERDSFLATAREEADRLRQELLEEARQQVDKTRSEWERALTRDRAAFLSELGERVTTEMYASLRRALGDLADEGLEERIALTLARRLSEVEPAERSALVRAADMAGGELTVVSRFDLGPEVRNRLESALHEALGEERTVHYRTDPSLVAGIELRAGDLKLGWSLEDWVAELQERVAGALTAAPSDDRGEA